jgi:hypothetical protein
MRRTVFHAAAFALALCALAAAPSRAAAQGAEPAPFPKLCVDCFRNLTTGLFECQAAQSGAHGCSLSDGGRTCTLSGGVCPTPLPPPDGAVAVGTLAASVTDEAAREQGAERVDAGGGRTLWKARCNGLVLARAYTPEAAAELRRRSAAITL